MEGFFFGCQYQKIITREVSRLRDMFCSDSVYHVKSNAIVQLQIVEYPGIL